MNLLFQLLAVYGVMFAARNASILDVPRAWLTRRSRFAAALLSCSFCTGFHAGWFVFVLSTNPRAWTTRDAALWAFAGATFSYALDVALLWVEARTPKKEPHVVLPTSSLSEDLRKIIQDELRQVQLDDQAAILKCMNEATKFEKSKGSAK